MMKKTVTLSKENTMPFPFDVKKHKAPSCFEKEKLWFEMKGRDPSVDAFDADCIDALIAKGIGNNLCPTDGENASFCIAGGIVAAITEKYPIISPGTPLHSPRINEQDTWEMLWIITEDRKKNSNISFLASMLRTFLPRHNDPLIDRPYYYESFFAHRWRFLVYPITFSREPQRICPEHIARGKKAFDRLPPATAAAITEAAWHIPVMLTMINERSPRR